MNEMTRCDAAASSVGSRAAETFVLHIPMVITTMADERTFDVRYSLLFA